MIISQANAGYKGFKLVIVPLCIVSSFFYAYFAAFRKDLDGGAENTALSGYTQSDIHYFDLL